MGEDALGTTLDLSELDSKIGQLFMAGIPGPELDGGTEVLIRDYNPCGIILFSRNIKDPVQLTKLCLAIQDKAVECHGLPLILSVDQEGGRVARLREPFTTFPGNAAIGEDDRPFEKAEEFGLVTAKEMKMVGLNMNLAPVVDVQRGEPEKHLAGRTFGDDPERVGLLGRTVVRSLQENGVMAVAKHFPGLGRTGLDPHFELPKIEVDMEEMERVNLPPFEAAIDEGVTAIMSSHAIYPALDPERPATLSSAILTDLLRKKLHFGGLIITDDLEMGAIAKHWGVAEGAAAAFGAGADVLLICQEQENILESIELIRSKFLRGEFSYERLNESSERIMKVRSGLLEAVQEIIIPKVEAYFKL